MSRQSTKNKKYALRKIGKVFGSCVVATVITLGGVAIMAPNVTVYASDTGADPGENNITDFASNDDGYEVRVPKGKKYIRNDKIESHEPVLKETGHDGRSFILKAEDSDDYFFEHPMGKLFEELYDKNGDGQPDSKYVRPDADTINEHAGEELSDGSGFKEPRISEIAPKYPHRLDAHLTNLGKTAPPYDSNNDGKPDAADGELTEEDTIVESNKPITVDPNAEENVVKDDGTVVLAMYYRIHVNEGDTADKKDDVYEVGTKPKEVVETTPKTTRYVGDPDTPYNTQVTSVDGHDGSVTKKTTYDLDEHTGQVTPHETITERVDKVDTIIKVGNKQVTTQEIPMTVTYKEDPTLEGGKTVVDDEGAPGEKETTTVYDVSETDGSLSNPQATEKTTKKMTPRVVRVGTKPKEVETPIPSPITYEANPDLKKDEKKTKTQGTPGKKIQEIRYEWIPNTDQVREVPGDDGEESPTPTVIEVGNVEKEVVETEITTRYIPDETKTRDEQEVVTPGSKGVHTRTTTYSVDPNTGATHTPVVTEDDKPMVQKVVRVGVKPKVEETPIPFPTRYERDDSVPNGQEVETVKGVDGKTVKKTTYTMNPDTGVVTQNEPTTEITKPVTRVVKVGTQQKVDVTPIPSPKRYEKDPEREKGQPNQEVPGKPGTSTTTTTYEVDPKTGNITEKVGDPVVVEPTETVVKVPAKDKVVTEEIPVVTEYEDDPTLEPGKEKEVTPGQPGEKTTTTTYTVDGKTGDITETTTTKITKEMVKRMVKRGPKEGTPSKPEQPSEPEDQPNLNVAPPTIAIVEEANKASIEVKAPKKDADTVKITYPKSDGSGEEVLTLTKQPSGEWTLDKQPENVTLDKKTGTVTIPRESVVNKEKVQAQAKHKTSAYTPFVYAALSIEEANPEYPVTLWVDRAGKELREPVDGKQPAGEIAGYKWLSSRLEEGILTHTFEKVANGTPILPESPTSHPRTPSSSPSTSTPEKPNKAETPAVRTVWRDENGKDLKVPSVDKQEAGEVPGYEFVESHREGDNLTVHVFRTKQAQTPAPKDQTPSPEQAASPAPSKVSEQKGEAVATATSEKTVDSATSTKTSDKAELPNTGTEANASLASAGIMTLLAGLGLGFFKKKED